MENAYSVDELYEKAAYFFKALEHLDNQMEILKDQVSEIYDQRENGMVQALLDERAVMDKVEAVYKSQLVLSEIIERLGFLVNSSDARIFAKYNQIRLMPLRQHIFIEFDEED